MSTLIDSLENAQLRRAPTFDAGDRVRVHFQVVEGTRRRTQVYEGVVIKRQGHGVRETFTVRKQSFGVGVERTFPLHSPKIERIEVAARGDVRRAKLYYLRGRVGKRARVRERRNVSPEQLVERDLVNVAPEPEEAESLVPAAVPEASEEAVAPEVSEETAAPEEPAAEEVSEETAASEEPAAEEVSEETAAPEEPAAEEEESQQSEEPVEESPASEEPAAQDGSTSDEPDSAGEAPDDEQ